VLVEEVVVDDEVLVEEVAFDHDEIILEFDGEVEVLFLKN